jgi:hypothetical protein
VWANPVRLHGTPAARKNHLDSASELLSRPAAGTEDRPMADRRGVPLRFRLPCNRGPCGAARPALDFHLISRRPISRCSADRRKAHCEPRDGAAMSRRPVCGAFEHRNWIRPVLGASTGPTPAS